MKFGEILKQILETHSIKQTELAKTLNVTQPYISNVIKNRTYPFGLNTINKMAKAFKLSKNEQQSLIKAAYNESGTKKSQRLKNLISETPTKILNWNNLDKQQNIFKLKIKDNTFSPEFIKGDIITVDPNKTPKKNSFVITENITTKKINIKVFNKISDKLEYIGTIISKEKVYH